jgi:hypothetical protein
MGTHLSFTVCSVNYLTQRYIQFQDYTYRRLADDKNFKRLICNVTPDNAEAEALSRMPNTKVFFSDTEGLSGSQSHGHGLNEILPLIDTEYAVFADPDTAALMPGWDTACLEALSDKSIAIGSPYHPDYTNRYQEFPNVIFFFFNVEMLRRLNVDFRPPPYPFRSIRQRLSRRIPFINLESKEMDVGWRLPKSFDSAGYSASYFDFIRCSDSQSVVLTPDARGDEYHWQGAPIITHQGRGAGKRGFNVDEVSKLWLSGVSDYLDLDDQVLSDITSV